MSDVKPSGQNHPHKNLAKKIYTTRIMNNEPIININGGLFMGRSSKYLKLHDSKRVGFGSMYLQALKGSVVSSRFISSSVPLGGGGTLMLKAVAIKKPP